MSESFSMGNRIKETENSILIIFTVAFFLSSWLVATFSKRSTKEFYQVLSIILVPLRCSHQKTIMKSSYLRRVPHSLCSPFFCNLVSSGFIIGLVGAGTHPGAGVPSVLMSAEITTRIIKKDIVAGKM